MGIGTHPHPPIALSFDLHTPFDPLNTTGAFPTDPSDLSGRVQDAVPRLLELRLDLGVSPIETTQISFNFESSIPIFCQVV